MQISGSILPDDVSKQVAQYSTENSKILTKESIVRNTCVEKQESDGAKFPLASQADSRPQSRGTQRILEICNQFKTREPPRPHGLSDLAKIASIEKPR